MGHWARETCKSEFKSPLFSSSQMKNLPQNKILLFLKGQIISKGLLVSSNSPKNQRNEFVFTSTTNSLVRFLGEFEYTKKSFLNYLTFVNRIKNSLIFGIFAHLYDFCGVWRCLFSLLNFIFHKKKLSYTR